MTLRHGDCALIGEVQFLLQDYLTDSWIASRYRSEAGLSKISETNTDVGVVKLGQGEPMPWCQVLEKVVLAGLLEDFEKYTFFLRIPCQVTSWCFLGRS